MSWKNIKLYRGFTLIELIIVIAIIGIMSAIGFSIWQSSKSDSYLRDAQREVASAVKAAQSYALQGRIQNGSVPCEYGVRFNKDRTSYTIFYMNCNNTTSNIETFNLNNGVRMNSGSLTVTFDVPFGNMSPTNSINIVLTHRGVSKNITINDGGSITEQ